MQRRLHIGGTIRAPGWEVLNVAPGADRHELGFDEDFLKHFLREAGFVNLRRVHSLGDRVQGRTHQPQRRR